MPVPARPNGSDDGIRAHQNAVTAVTMRYSEGRHCRMGIAMSDGNQKWSGDRTRKLVIHVLLAVHLVSAFAARAWSAQRPAATAAGISSDVRFELPDSVEMQERAGLTVQGAFIGHGDTPSWIATPSETWIHVLLRDSAGKLLIERPLRPSPPGRSPEVIPTVVYSRLGFPFEVLPRCESLSPGRYRLEIRYDSPGLNQAVAVSKAAVLALTVRSNAAVPLRHLSLEVPSRVVYDDFRVPVFGLPVRVLNDGCESQTVMPFAPESVSIQVRTSDGRTITCRSATVISAAAPITLMPANTWAILVPFSGRCDIPLPGGANERTHYRVQVSYRGPGWTGSPLRLDQNVDLELANIPHSSRN
jgi:hypothetical protein